MLKGLVPRDEPLIVFDEVHKYLRWRNLVKGLFDRYRKSKRFLVTGSARLDYFSRGGDSLQGRYHLYRLHPLSLRELDKKLTQETVTRLLKFGGFPEPYFQNNERAWRRWQQERKRRVLQEDVVWLEQVKDLSLLGLLAEALPAKVGSPLSVQNLRNNLQVTHATTERWLQILENLYYCFRISPYGGPKIKAVRKEQKLYLWDWSVCADEAQRFENMVACQLLKYCHLLEDTEGYDMELRYVRDVEKREIDFVVLKGKKPLFAVECKLGERQLSRQLRYFSERLPIPEFYQVHLDGHDISYEDVTSRSTVLSFCSLVRTLGLP